MQDLNYIAVDFETANEARGSACALGISVIENSQIVESRSWLFPPKDKYFNEYNTFIHGITYEDVENKPELNILWDKELKIYFENRLIVAHNASFDMSVLRHSLQNYGIAFPECEYLCSYLIAKATWTKELSYSLPNLASMLGFSFIHHNPEHDSKACAFIFNEAYKLSEVPNLDGLLNKLGYRKGELFKDGYIPSRKIRHGSHGIDLKALQELRENSDLDQEHPFFEKHKEQRLKS